MKIIEKIMQLVHPAKGGNHLTGSNNQWPEADIEPLNMARRPRTITHPELLDLYRAMDLAG